MKVLFNNYIILPLSHSKTFPPELQHQYNKSIFNIWYFFQK